MDESKVSGPNEEKNNEKRTTASAIVSFILGILSVLSFVIGPLIGIAAVIFGHIARSAVKKNPSGLKGNGLAIAGLVMGYYSIAVFLLFSLLIGAVGIYKYKDNEAKINKLRQQPGVIVAHTPATLLIDGNADQAWESAKLYKISNIMSTVSSGESVTPPASPNDFSGQFRAMWDDKNFYLLVEVTDDMLINDTSPDQWVKLKSGSDALPFWFDDCIEVYIDAKNCKQKRYNDDDAHYHFDWDSANPTMDKYEHGSTENVEFAIVTTEKGYNVEIKFPWATLGVKPEAELTIGLDVQANDDDDGIERDSKIGWHSREDTDWKNPQAFGNAKLSAPAAAAPGKNI